MLTLRQLETLLRRHELAARQRLVNRLLRGVHLQGVQFGERSISMSPAGVGDVIRWSATQVALALGDLGMNKTTGHPTAYIGGAARSLSYPAMSKVVTAKTVDYPILSDPSDDNGVTYTNDGATGTVIFTLPSAVAGLFHTFVCAEAQSLEIKANTGDTVRIGTMESTTGGSLSSAIKGNFVTVVAVNADEWIATAVVGIWS